MTGSLVPADREFLTRFEQCTLPESEWSHLAHIRVAWIWFRLSRADEALDRICKGILRYNTGVLHRRHKYHETVTIAFAHIISDRMKKGEPWITFVDRIDDLLDPRNPILLSYYSANRLFSDEARLTFVQPDLRDIPQVPDNLREK